MVSTVVKGMPYTTMEYHERQATSDFGNKLLPTITSPIGLAKKPLLDGKSGLDCSKHGTSALVEKELELHFDSDYTWLVFFSEPVWLQCHSSKGTMIQILESDSDGKDGDQQPLIVRAALLDTCTTGSNKNLCKEGFGDRLPDEDQVKEYAEILRQSSPYYPGAQSSVTFEIEDDATEGFLTLDWDVQTFPGVVGNASTAGSPQSLRNLKETPQEAGLVMFALPHHLDRFDSTMWPNGVKYCKWSLNGEICLVKGSSWTLKEDLPRIGLQAARPPRAEFLPAIGNAVLEDIGFALPEFFERGAGDTYFSGKMLSKLARILLVAEELVEICEGKVDEADAKEYDDACANFTLPSAENRTAALDRLRRSVEVWINGTAESPFVYDEAWGGVVNCGCNFNEGTCLNTYPDCPAFVDQGLNFGNGEFLGGDDLVHEKCVANSVFCLYRILQRSPLPLRVSHSRGSCRCTLRPRVGQEAL